MSKDERFTSEAFKKVTDPKIIEEAKRRAEQLKLETAPKPKNNEIS